MADKDTEKGSEKSEFASLEERILDFWEKNKIFERTLKKPSPKGEFVFYEGPPTANGRPGIHHLEARAFKDAIPRFKTMQGYHVRRKAGWDTHGLPVELEVEKELKFSSKKDIENYGIGRFNKKCKESVLKYLADWNAFTRRIGFWVDQENPYFTFDPNFMESVWWVIKQAHEKKLLYKDYRVVPWCPRCGTSLSSHELGQPGAYVDVKDLSVYVKFKITDEKFKHTSILAWTTTPWTLPGNVALAVGSDIDYVKIKIGNEFLILAKDRLSVIKDEYEIIEELKGRDLIGMSYEPLYPFVRDHISGPEKTKLTNAFKVYPASFVTTTDGTGVVHTAVMYGAEDFELGNQIGLPKYHLVNEDGTFKMETGFLAGRFVRDEETAVAIIKDLAKRELLFAKEKFEHSYPHCWRCKTALIYFARDSWYIKMSGLRAEMIKENQEINWEPNHIKEGRFGEWLREAKDWNISRERYWGTPLPIWQCTSCKEKTVIGSVAEIKEKIKKSGNKYFVCRHGEAEKNVLNIASTHHLNESALTEKGVTDVKAAAGKLKDKKIEFIFSSPFLRTKETAKIIAHELGLGEDKIIFDDRLREISVGDFDGKSIEDYRNFFNSNLEKFDKRPPNAETMTEVRQRVMKFLYEVENSHKNKNILIISHGDPIWAIIGGATGMTKEKMAEIKELRKEILEKAEWREIDFTPLPHNEDFELDLHRPHIDECILNCSCGGEAVRLPEVLDVWLDSGTMPFSQDHYPFENKEWVESKGFPADFISEAIDQTRGWFYTLHAVGAILGRGKAYRNVICLGHVLDAKGKKMSKSSDNAVDPNFEIAKYGADSLRFFMYAVNQPGESKNYDEKMVTEISKKTFNLLLNVLTFFETYKADVPTNKELKNVLDRWLLTKLQILTNHVTKEMENYRIYGAARAIREFIFDLSQWYLRRSRDRFKAGGKEAEEAIATTRFALLEIAKLLAPLTPFIAEEIWKRVGGNEESVHLAEWPRTEIVDEKIITQMDQVRNIVSQALLLRSKAGLKVRQPLASLTIKEKVNKEFLPIIADEINVKEVLINPKAEDLIIDTNITEDLKKEGSLREFTRSLQEMRKKEGLQPATAVNLIVETNSEGRQFIEEFAKEIKSAVSVKEIRFESTAGAELKIEHLSFKIAIVK